jgi:ribonucleoside-diphosphate reductase alpha chain
MENGRSSMSDELSIYEELSLERKELQEKGELPPWFTTAGWQLFKTKGRVGDESYRDRIKTICKTMAKHTDDPKSWEKRFFEISWKGWLAFSSPVLTNGGTERGCPVSCSGNYVEDSVEGFFDSIKETALLSKAGFGTSSNLSDIRHRGTAFAHGGKADGVIPVIEHFVATARHISQGNARRGSWAGYLDIEHGDFWEVTEFLKNNPDDLNVGWSVKDSFIRKLEKGDPDSVARYQRALKIRAQTGKGYFFFTDKVNRLSPKVYKDNGLSVEASNLCTEITLPSSADETFTCVLSSMNAFLYDEWKDTDAVFVATVFLDCVAQDFIVRGSKIKGLEKAVKFTERHRALGLGCLGFHSYLQSKMIAFESMEAHLINGEIFKHIDQESLRASQWMAENWGEPELMKGTGLRNAHRTAVAPNMSSAIYAGGVSQGIEPIYENAFTQKTAGGEIQRVNPQLISIMEAKGVYTEKTIKDIIDNEGSVQHVDWLTPEEKLVFKTAFEIDQSVIIRLASARQNFITQAQSINLFFAADESEEYISEIHQLAFRDKRIKSLYYMRSKAGVKASKGECAACEG